MKASGVVLTCLLLMNLFLTIFSEDEDYDHAAGDLFPCCFAYENGRFSRSSIVAYYYTDTDCTMYAVIFEFKDGSTKCGDPYNKENQKIMKFLDKKGKNRTSVAPSGT